MVQSRRRMVIALAFWIALFSSFLFCLYKLGLSTKWILILGAWSVVAIFYHLRKQKNDGDYIKKILAIDKYANANNLYEYDLLRVIAVCFVIITHAIQTDMSLDLITGTKTTIVYTWLFVVTLSCNLIYVMLSGALLLPWKKQSISDFYFKRVLRILLPMVVYYVWYLWQNRSVGKVGLQGFISKLYFGNTTESPHYWLLYVILALYISIPFLRFMFKSMDYKTLTTMVITALICMGLLLYVGRPIAVNSFLSSWIGIAIMGYWVTREDTRKYDGFVITAGAISAAVMLLLILYNPKFLSYSTNCSPLMCLLAMSVFSVVLSLKKHIRKHYIVVLLSKYSYSIILIHWWTLHWITRKRFNIATNMFMGGGILISLLITMVVSFAASFALDNLICNIAVDYIGRAYARVSGCITKKREAREKEENT